MIWTTFIAGVFGVLTQAEPVDLALRLPEIAVIEARLERSERQDGGDWVTVRSAYRVTVEPEGENAYRTVWHDLGDPLSIAMIILTDEALVPGRILNLEEILQRVEDDGGTDKDSVASMAFMRALSPETLSSLLTRDLILAAYGQGTALVPGERIEYQESGGSFGDSGQMVLNASFLLESVKPELDRAVVIWVNEIDPEEARKALPGLVRDLFNLAGADVETRDKFAAIIADARLIRRTECRYEIVMATGLADSVACTLMQDISIAGESRRTETRLIATQRLLPTSAATRSSGTGPAKR